MELKTLSELSESETFQVIDLLECETDDCYMSAWDRIENNYLFDSQLNHYPK